MTCIQYTYILPYTPTLYIYTHPIPSTLIADPRALVASGRENVELREIALLRQQQMQRDEQVKREQQLLYKQQQQLTSSSTSSQFNTHTSHSTEEGQSGMGHKSDRVRTPYSSGFLFTVQPEYKVSAVSSEGKKAAAKVSVYWV